MLSRMWNIDTLVPDVDELAEACSKGTVAPPPSVDRLPRVLLPSRSSTWEAFQKSQALPPRELGSGRQLQLPRGFPHYRPLSASVVQRGVTRTGGAPVSSGLERRRA